MVNLPTNHTGESHENNHDADHQVRQEHHDERPPRRTQRRRTAVLSRRNVCGGTGHSHPLEAGAHRPVDVMVRNRKEGAHALDDAQADGGRPGGRDVHRHC